MNYNRYLPPHVREALAYDPPGSWMPPLPPGVVRLSAGYPFPAAVPSQDLAQATAELLAAEGDKPLQYLGSPAMASLPALLRRRMAERGMALAESELMVTAGGCQAIDLAARALLGPDDLVAVEAPTYMEALEIFRNYTPQIVGYPVDGAGLDVEALAHDLAERRAAGRPTPKLLYTIASFQNPTGTTMPLARRQALLRLAEAYDFLILEDDAYGELAFGEAPPPLKALDTQGRVIYIGSLSKVIAPGLRVGWAAAAAPLIQAMSLYKKDLEAPLSMAITARYLAGIDLGARVAELRRRYRERRDWAVAALERYMGDRVRWQVPEGGFFLWLHTPGVDTAALLPRALEAGVAYVPGKYFFFGEGSGREYLRISYSYLEPGALERGIAILARALEMA
jgi:2-aminoadipate transaminase